MSEIATPHIVTKWADLISAAWRQSVDGIIKCGQLLIAARAQLSSDDYKAMVNECLPFKERTAQRLTAIAEDERITNPTHVSLLPASWGTLYELTRLEDEDWKAAIIDGTINPDMDRKDIAQKTKRAARDMRERNLAQSIEALPQKKYGVIVADPEWRFEPWSRESGMDRAADNHYPTSCTEVIASRDVASIAAADCVLFLWATAPMLPQALAVMGAWGFDYRSGYVWAKDKIGTGYWGRNQHEHLLIGVKGNVPAPAMGTQYPTLIRGAVTRHSAKPECVLEMIEQYFPTLPKIELNRRGAVRAGWEAWGNEAETSAAPLINESELSAVNARIRDVYEGAPTLGDLDQGEWAERRPDGVWWVHDAVYRRPFEKQSITEGTGQ